MAKMYIPEIFNNLLGQMDVPMSLFHWETQNTYKGTFTLLFQVIDLPEQCVTVPSTLKPKHSNVGANEMLQIFNICLYSSSHTFYIYEAPCVNIVQMFPSNYSPGSHTFPVIAVQHIAAQLVPSQLSTQM